MGEMEEQIEGSRRVEVRDRLSGFISRKFIISQQVILAAVGLPILYSYLGISEMVTLTVLGVLTGVGSVYGVVNMVQKKFE